MGTKDVKFKNFMVVALLIISVFFGISVPAQDTTLISFKKDFAHTFSAVKETEVSANPEVSSISMDDGNIIIEFSKPMDPSTLNNDTVILTIVLPGVGYGTVAGKLESDDTAALFVPQSDLISELGYTVTITTDAKDADGNSLQSDYTQSFTVSGLNSKYGRQLQAALDTQVALQEIPGATLFVSDPDKGEWSLAAGSSVLDPETAMNPADRFRIGSITKTFTASAVLRLVDEGMLTLDDPVEQYLPELEIPKNDIITIRHLLNHTSGLADYVDYVLNNILLYDPLHVFQPGELVQIGIEQAPDLLFEPGTGWLYSNTGYIVLGMIIESVTGSSYAAEIRRHFIEPFGLANTFVPEDESIPGNHAHGYLDINGDGELDNVTNINPSVAWSAGNMISNTEDLAHWARALYGGKVLSEASLAEMLDISDDYFYGLGVQYEEVLGIGHAGRIVGYNSLMAFNPDTGVIVCLLINKAHADTLPIAHEVLNALGRLSWTTVFDRLHATISTRYAFTDWKGISETSPRQSNKLLCK
ncbi:MAG: serine hydrolase [Desulfobacteraceae bacterium]|nr:serine hydrolase [Desulfobacteraceae bacterium]